MIIKKRDFVSNNIVLRELSSLCISKYKESQANALSELRDNDHHTFSVTAKEILLLKYDTYFRWLIEVEDTLRRNTENIPNIIMQISDELENEYIEILINHPKIFDRAFVDIWLKAHKYMYEYVKKKIKGLTVESQEDFMLMVTDMLILVMDNTLFELHEIDNILRGGAPFVSYDDLCHDYMKVMGCDRCLLTDRLSVYNYFVDLPKEVTIKDYSKKSLLLNNEFLATTTANQLKVFGYDLLTII